MKLVSFEVETPFGPVRRIGAVLAAEITDDAPIVDLNTGYGALLAAEDDPRWPAIADAALPPDMIAFLEGGEAAMERARRVVASHPQAPSAIEGRRVTFRRGDVRLLSPVPRPASLRDFTVYEEHMSRARPDSQKPPAWYHFGTCYKGNPHMVFGPEDPMRWPGYSERFDPELELAAVIGRRGTNVSIEDADRYIAGYTVFVDGSARDIAPQEMLGPFKHKDFGTNLGPCIVTPDEFDELNAHCSLRVNGATWWEGNTGQGRNFRMRDLVAYTAEEEVLQPGDVIAAGTVGDSCSMDTGNWITPGDVVELTIEGIGTMRHTAVREPRERSYVRDGMTGMLPLPDYAQDYPRQLREGRA